MVAPVLINLTLKVVAAEATCFASAEWEKVIGGSHLGAEMAQGLRPSFAACNSFGRLHGGSTKLLRAKMLAWWLVETRVWWCLPNFLCH